MQLNKTMIGYALMAALVAAGGMYISNNEDYNNQLRASLLEPEARDGEVSLAQRVTDLNGGGLAIGDRLKVEVAVRNGTDVTIPNMKMKQVVPPGSAVDENTLEANAKATKATFSGEKFKTLEHEQGTLNMGETAYYTYETVVKDSPLYFINNSSSGAEMYKLDPNTGAGEYIGMGEKPSYGLALSADARYLYGVNSSTDSTWRYDLVTETRTNIGSLDLGNVSVPCLDFDASGRLFGADSKKNELFEINLETGKGTVVAALGMKISGGDCAFGADGQLYVMSNTNDGAGALWVADPVSGAAKPVSNVSDSEFFTGLALSTNGMLYGSGTTTDALHLIDPTNGVGTSIGGYGFNHGGGDLAMTASQQIKMVFAVDYIDDNGNEASAQEVVTYTAPPPEVGTKGDIREQTRPEITEEPYCIRYDDPETCVFPANFNQKMGYYIDDVVAHHWAEVAARASSEVAERDLSGDEAAAYLQSVYADVVRPTRDSAQQTAEQMLADFIATHQNQPGPCPHEQVIMKAIREELTRRQALAELGVMLHQNPGANVCDISAQDTLIRHGDEISIGWASTGTTGTVEPYIGPVGGEGVERIRPLETTTFTFTTNTGATCSTTVVVEPACEIGFVSPKVKPGAGTQVIWNGKGSGAVSLTELGDVAYSGVGSVFPSTTTNYILTGYTDGKVTAQCAKTLYVEGEIPDCTD